MSTRTVAHDLALAIRHYLAGDEDAARLQAYQVARDAMAAGAGLMEIVSEHQAGVAIVVSESWESESSILRIRAASDLLAELLAPFEMVHRRFQETNEALLAINRDLEQKIHERDADGERERMQARAEKERLEGQLHQAQRLESLGQLAGGVAHDFNNLLAVILNYSAFVAQEIRDAPLQAETERWTKVREDVEQVRLAAERATRLTRQLLTFGRRDVVHPRVINLNDVVEGITELLLRSIGEHVELVTALQPGLWPIMADPGQIEQLLMNLSVNARDAMPSGGTLRIATENAAIGQDDPILERGLGAGRYVRLRVSDTGSGMSHEVQEHAFEPFFTTKEKGEGTGLGLATVYGVIRQAGGDIEVRSEPGAGTVFTALLPVTEVAPAAVRPLFVETASPANGAPGAQTVLVVEDEAAMREVTRRLLERNGYRVITAASGPEAVTIVERHEGDLHALLTDVVMPRMSGKELAERITALRPGIVVMFMSGYAQPVLAARGTLEHGVVLIEKPFTENELLAKVRGAIRPAPAA